MVLQVFQSVLAVGRFGSLVFLVMKIPRYWLFVPVSVWFFAGCGEKETESVGVSYETPAELAAEATGQVPDVEVPAEVKPAEQ